MTGPIDGAAVRRQSITASPIASTTVRRAVDIRPARVEPGAVFERAAVEPAAPKVVPRPAAMPKSTPAFSSRGPAVGQAATGVRLMAFGLPSIPNPLDVIDDVLDGIGNAFDAIKGAVVKVGSTVVEFAKDGFKLVQDGARQLVQVPLKVAGGGTKFLKFALEKGVDAAKWIDAHKQEIAAAAAVAALVVGTGGTAGIALAGVAGGLAVWSAADNVKQGNYGAAALDVVLAIPGTGVAGRLAKQGFKLQGVQKGFGVFRKVAAGVNAAVDAKTAAALLKLSKAGVKYSDEAVVFAREVPESVFKTKAGVVFLEKGNPRSGLMHILDGNGTKPGHAADFLKRGVARDQVDDLIEAALTRGKVLKSNSRGIDVEVMFNGQKQTLRIGIGNNGYVVTAHPITPKGGTGAAVGGP